MHLYMCIDVYVLTQTHTMQNRSISATPRIQVPRGDEGSKAQQASCCIQPTHRSAKRGTQIRQGGIQAPAGSRDMRCVPHHKKIVFSFSFVKFRQYTTSHLWHLVFTDILPYFTQVASHVKRRKAENPHTAMCILMVVQSSHL